VRTARLAEAHDLRLRHTLFPLHPDTPAEGMTLEALFGGRVDLEASRARMALLMEQEGLPYGDRTHTYNSRVAQEVAKWAETQPGGDAIHDALYRAYFVSGLNLAQPDVLLDVVGALGLDRKAAQEVISERSFSDRVDLDWQRARELGVTGVPTFVVGRHGVAGAQPYDILEKLVLEAPRQ